jgi:hypothetical protein
MAPLNIFQVQAKLTTYLDLLDCLRTETAGGQEDEETNITLETLTKITLYLLANEDKWLSDAITILDQIADNIVHHHYSKY